MKKFAVMVAMLIFTINSAFATGTEALLLYNKGLDYYKIGLYDEAISYFKRSIEADPDFTDAYFNLGSVHEFLQQYDEALAVFRQVVVRNPEDYDSVYHAAWLSYKLGEEDKARMYLTLIPSTSDRAADARKLYAMMGESPKFKEDIKKEQPKAKQNDIFDNIASPTGIAVDNDGNIYVAQFGANSITKITPDGKKILYIKNPKINGPIGIAFDKSGNLYIANYNDDNVLKVSSGGAISVLLSKISKPYGLTIKDGTLYVSLQGSGSVIKYKL
ncbi:tetratricopeptide repeat protein [bacterium]|nr:tetratricopeptide repeat protein [bacterium]